MISNAVAAGNGSDHLPRRAMAAVDPCGLFQQRAHLPSDISFVVREKPRKSIAWILHAAGMATVRSSASLIDVPAAAVAIKHAAPAMCA